MQKNETHINTLILRCKKGDKRAQMEIYNSYAQAMYNTSLRIVNHTAEAEDIMQESFLKAFSKLESFRGKSTFGAWLKRIVINESLAQLRQNKIKTEPYKNYLKIETEEDILQPAEKINDLKVKKILKALQNLKENYRLCLNLYLIEGYDYEEISEITGFSYANCRTSVSRAKKKLRQIMQEHEFKNI